MLFTTDFDVARGSHVLVFVRDDIKLRFSPSEPNPIKVPIETEGCIGFGYSQLNLKWNEKYFTFSSSNADYWGAETLSVSVPITPELMSSFKVAVDEWNSQFETSWNLKDKHSNTITISMMDEVEEEAH